MASECESAGGYNTAMVDWRKRSQFSLRILEPNPLDRRDRASRLYSVHIETTSLFACSFKSLVFQFFFSKTLDQCYPNATILFSVNDVVQEIFLCTILKFSRQRKSANFNLYFSQHYVSI